MIQNRKYSSERFWIFFKSIYGKFIFSTMDQLQFFHLKLLESWLNEKISTMSQTVYFSTAPWGIRCPIFEMPHLADYRYAISTVNFTEDAGRWILDLETQNFAKYCRTYAYIFRTTHDNISKKVHFRPTLLHTSRTIDYIKP